MRLLWMRILSSFFSCIRVVVAKLENHLVAFRDLIQRALFQQRCSEETFGQSQAANENEYDPELLNHPTCPEWKDDPTDIASISSTDSIVRVAPTADITHPQVLEALYYSRWMDEWLIQRAEQDKEVWERIGGAFRMFPGIPSETCGDCNNRDRPWNACGSSGTKNVALVLDVSSFTEGERLDRMKLAAIQMIETLTISDRVKKQKSAI